MFPKQKKSKIWMALYCIRTIKIIKFIGETINCTVEKKEQQRPITDFYIFLSWEISLSLPFIGDPPNRRPKKYFIFFFGILIHINWKIFFFCLFLHSYLYHYQYQNIHINFKFIGTKKIFYINFYSKIMKIIFFFFIFRSLLTPFCSTKIFILIISEVHRFSEGI